MNDGDELEESYQIIDFEKYLKCAQCQKIEHYCPEHRIEVEKKLKKLEYNEKKTNFRA